MKASQLDPTVEALIDAALSEIREQMRREFAETDLTHATLDEIEAAIERVGSQWQRHFQRRLLEERSLGPRDNTVACPCGGSARYRKRVSRELTTRHGTLTLWRPYYYCAGCQEGFAPLDHALGLDAGSTTTQVRLWIADLAARLTFPEAMDVLSRLVEVQVGASTVERTAVAVGTALRQAQRQAAVQHHAGHPPPVQCKPKRLYVSMDGKMVPLRDPWKKDGSVGSLVCRWGECKTAAIYEAHPGPEGDAGVAQVAYTATMGDVSEFTPLVATLAHQRGHHFAPELAVLADGSVWLWNLAAAQFPTAVQIVDFMHASGHLFTVAHAFLGEGTAAAKEWVTARQAELKEDGVAAVLAAIRAFSPQSDKEAELRASEVRYFETNAERMRYGTFQKKGYHIASGVMEAACKHVVGQRLDQAGMHWREETAEAILALRAALLSTQPPDLRPYCCFSHAHAELPHS